MKLINQHFTTLVILLAISSTVFASSDPLANNLPQNKYPPATLSNFYQCENNALININDDEASLNTVNYFGTSVSITLYNVEHKKAKSMLCNALSVIQEYHYLASNYSTYGHVTNIKTINESPAEKHQIDPLLTELIAAGIDWHQRSGGYFNIALSPVIDLWRTHRFACLKGNSQASECSIPSQTELNHAALLTNINDVSLDRVHNTVRMKPGMSIDLGGIAKGWMAEKVYDQLKVDGAEQFIINAGGNIRHLGLHPEGRQFATAVEDPVCKKSNYQLAKCNEPSGQYHEVITGKDITVVSSGNYLRYFVVNGQQYHHLIDPKTLYPKPKGIATTVVLNSHQLYADVISTMLFLMPLQTALDYVNKRDYIEAVWYLNEQGDKVESNKFDSFTGN
ncbi:FAD:protein FMN transferase [Shewanella colwelliana]|uniref:FAD:protein FMN transferase n=1 Tax=Shewanella colwelliana TaxID=23 RepID=UPI001C7D3CF1|nr:FAD:protein FMN transferase [Shewanella colwelliana]